MLTVQEIQAMTFEKAVFGGYDMKSVDEFVEHVAEDVGAMQKEIAALKSKMKVLVDKIEEYKSVEDGMRRALVSAQNIAQETIQKAQTDADQVMATAKKEFETKLAAFRSEYAQEEARLDTIKQQNAEFLSKIAAMYENQLAILRSGGVPVGQASEQPITAPPQTQPMSKREKHVQTPPTQETFAATKPIAAQPSAKEKEYQIPSDIRQYMDQQRPQTGQPEPAPTRDENAMNVKMVELKLGSEKGQKSAETGGGDSPFHFGELKFGAEYSPENDK